MGQKENPNRGPQVAGSMFPFTNKVPFFNLLGTPGARAV